MRQNRKRDNIQLSINVYSVAHRNLHLPYAFAWFRALLAISNGGLKLITPWAPPTISIAIIITQKIITASLCTATYLKRLVDGA